MNKQIKKLTTLTIIIILILFGSTTYYQFFEANSLKKDSRNSRTFFETFNNNRGPIVVDGKEIAYSTPTKDDYGYIRHYTDGPLYAPITGYYSVVYGMGGLENKANDALMGKSDSFSFLNLENLITGKKPQGGIVELTIDSKIQKAIYNAFGTQKGAAVAIDPQTGEIKAMVSKPSYDPNLLAPHNTKTVVQNYNKLLNNPNNPMLSRANEQLYAPGSTFKLVTASAALENKKYNKNSLIPAPNRYKLPQTNKYLSNMNNETCSSSGKTSLSAALDLSCNTAFAMLGVKLGGAKLGEQAKKFGFGSGFNIPNTVVSSVFPSNINKSQVAMSAIGQYNVNTSVMQNALIVSSIYNDGKMMTPHLIKNVRDSDLRIMSSSNPTVLKEPLSYGSAKQIKEMMISVAKQGTGRIGLIPGAEVGAKTGTAEKGKGKKPNTWFVSFVKKGDKQLVVAVLVEDGGRIGLTGTGASIAGPIAKIAMQAYINNR